MSILIAYGSHTGQAETIAHQVEEKCNRIGIKSRIFPLDENEKAFFLDKEPLAVIIVSSTGDGDPPENAARFLRRISSRSLPNDLLSNLEFALLGLGDSNYSTYQGTPKKIEKRLIQLGATKLLPTGEADDQVGLELAVEPWIENVLLKLCQLFDIPISKLDELESAPLIQTSRPDTSLFSKMNINNDSNEPMTTTLTINPYNYPGEVSLVKGSTALSSDEALRVPISPLPFLTTSVTHEIFDSTQVIWQNGDRIPGSHGSPVDVTVVGTTLLTSLDAHKPKREIIIDFGPKTEEMSFGPGDAFYFLQPNPKTEVDFILDRMGLLTLADQKCFVEIAKDGSKPNPTVPSYIPATSSLRYIFTNCLDIRRSPSRPVLRIFAESTDNEAERRRLLELCSAQGMTEFTTHVRQAAVSLVDVLLAFPGVRPQPERLIEQLPRLIPRPYSVANCKERARGRLRFIYSQLMFEDTEGRRYKRYGLATEWLNSLKVGDKIQVMMKEPARFRLPPPPLEWQDAIGMPLLMIGPGTGVATFLSFLDKLLYHKLNHGNLLVVPRLLFFGCRDFGKDFICRDQLESYVRDGIIDELVPCESQPAVSTPDRDKYVQDALKRRSPQIYAFLELPNSRVFVCGDAKAMSKDAWECFTQIVKNNKGCSDAEARAYLLEMKKNDRYIEDVWA